MIRRGVEFVGVMALTPLGWWVPGLGEGSGDPVSEPVG